MTNTSESLTIRILGDSTQLQRELASSGQALDNFLSRTQRAADSQNAFGDTIGRLAGQSRSVDALGSAFDRIAQRVQSLARMPVTLNVSPALNALALLGNALDQIAAKALSLRAIGSVSGIPSIPAIPNVPRLATGGLVQGTPGPDRVPAMLTAGEFVINQTAVNQLGVGFLSRLNDTGSRAVSPGSTNTSSHNSTVNHLGGITVNVSQPAEVQQVLRQIQFANSALRNRRG